MDHAVRIVTLDEGVGINWGLTQGQRTLTRLIDRAYAGFSFKVAPYEFAGAQCESSRLSLE